MQNVTLLPVICLIKSWRKFTKVYKSNIVHLTPPTLWINLHRPFPRSNFIGTWELFGPYENWTLFCPRDHWHISHTSKPRPKRVKVICFIWFCLNRRQFKYLMCHTKFAGKLPKNIFDILCLSSKLVIILNKLEMKELGQIHCRQPPFLLCDKT